MPAPAFRLLARVVAPRDPRQLAEVLHPLAEILLLMLGAALPGADDWVEIHLRGTEQRGFLRRMGSAG